MPVVRRSRRGSTSRAQRPHPAMGVLHAGAKEQVQQTREDRIADIAVKPRHRSGLDVVHAVAHHQLRAAVQLGHEARDLVEVVGQIGVGHHDVAPVRRREAGQVGAAIAASRFGYHARARRPRKRRRIVLGGVVHDQHFPVDIRALQHLQGGAHALLDVLRLVQARDHDRHECRSRLLGALGDCGPALLCGAHGLCRSRARSLQVRPRGDKPLAGPKVAHRVVKQHAFRSQMLADRAAKTSRRDRDSQSQHPLVNPLPSNPD